MNFRLNTIVFCCGACVMVLEMVGSRLMAPYLGTSIFVWTSLIGIILGCLSLGYWAGGVWADRKPEPKNLSFILLASSLSTLLIGLVGDPVLAFLQSQIMDVRVASVLATVVLFGVPSTLLGMVSPFSVKLKLSQIEKAGSTAGELYALSTLGSIAGTFLAGFVLMAFFSHRAILFSIGAVLAALAPLAGLGKKTGAKWIFALLAAGGAALSPPFVERVMGENFTDLHTPYNRAWIYEAFAEGRAVRVLQINDTGDSAMFIGSDDLVFKYTRYFRLAEHFHPDIRQTLMIGGGAYSFPKYFLNAHPDATMDVVEIDPGVTEAAIKFFGLKPNPRLQIFHEDARTFLNQNTKRYDVVYGDVYKSYTVPFQLTTVEATRRISASLEEDGIFVMNVISTLEGPDSRFLGAVLSTLREVFPQIYVFAAENPDNLREPQNFVVVSFKSKARRSFYSQDPEIIKMLGNAVSHESSQSAPALRDNFAPVEFYMEGIIEHHPGRRDSFLQKKWRQPKA